MLGRGSFTCHADIGFKVFCANIIAYLLCYAIKQGVHFGLVIGSRYLLYELPR